MRVIAGRAKGHRLQSVEGLGTRPTTDRIKETLFNLIAFDLPDAHFLDLFSGSGAIGIEALSRGASQAVFVEQESACHRIIQENLAHTKLLDAARLMPMSVQSALLKLQQEGAQFDVIFMDPPYASDLAEEALRLIVANNLLKPEGYVIVERASNKELPHIKGLETFKEKVYKTTVMSFLCLEDRT